MIRLFTSIPSSCCTPLVYTSGADYINNSGKKPGSPDSTTEFNPDGTPVVRVRLPKKKLNEQFAMAELMMGANHIRVRCHDGVERMGRIKGKIKKRAWIREGDILIIVPWSFQDEKCDILYRYLPPQADWLRKNKYL
jgi:translation initiation factor 1A